VLLVPVLHQDAVDDSWRLDADAVALDLCGDLAAARPLLAEAIATAGRGGAEVFVCIDKARAYAQVKSAAVARGLSGIVVANVENAGDIKELETVLAEREREEGIPTGTLEIFPLIGTARGVWNVREVVHASPRIACVALDEPGLCRSIGIIPTDAFDALSFSRGRVIVETLAAVKLPLGIGHPLGARPRETDDETLTQVADRARNSGFKGALCPFSSWVAACNTAFTPSDEQVASYREVRLAFAEGVKRGTAAVPFPGGRMIDVPVDERARLVIDWWERCRRRDAAKAATLTGVLQRR
jgi:citrate lyase subunit beta/citryl-CoA lyase